MAQDHALREAQALLKAKRYDEAHRLLKKIDHPTAQKWLKQLDQIAPTAPTKASSSLLIPAIITAVIVAGAMIAVIIFDSKNETSVGNPPLPSPSWTAPVIIDHDVSIPQHAAATEAICDEYCLEATNIVATNSVVVGGISATETAIANYLNTQPTPSD